MSTARSIHSIVCRVFCQLADVLQRLRGRRWSDIGWRDSAVTRRVREAVVAPARERSQLEFDFLSGDGLDGSLGGVFYLVQDFLYALRCSKRRIFEAMRIGVFAGKFMVERRGSHVERFCIIFFEPAFGLQGCALCTHRRTRQSINETQRTERREGA